MGRAKRPENSIGILSERKLPDGRRKITLRKQERKDIQKQLQIEQAVALFLDVQVGRTWKQVADEMGIPPQKLRELTKSEEFEIAYDQMFAEIGHDPRFKATQSWMLDLLPVAMRELYELLTDPQTPPSVRLNSIKLIMDLTNIDIKPDTKQDDRKDMMKFLFENRAEIIIPPEFQDAMAKFRPPEIEAEAPIEGEFLPTSEDH